MAGGSVPGPTGLNGNPPQIQDGTLTRQASPVPNPLGFPKPSASNENVLEIIPGRAFLFILADEVLPSGKLVRKVLRVPTTNADYVAAHPEIFGLSPKDQHSSVTIGKHALGNTNSRYTSASSKRGGAPNFQGRSIYIDIAKAKAAGVTIHSTQEIIADLDNIAKENPRMKSRIEKLKSVITPVEGEVLLEGKVPATAIKSQTAMNLTRGLRFIQFVGITITIRDLGNASAESVRTESIKPIAAETVRQAGGWGGAVVGVQVGGWASALLAAKIGGATGAAFGIESGPGAIVTGAIGALIFGTAGYYGADWIADWIHEN